MAKKWKTKSFKKSIKIVVVGIYWRCTAQSPTSSIPHSSFFPHLIPLLFGAALSCVKMSNASRYVHRDPEAIQIEILKLNFLGFRFRPGGINVESRERIV